MMVAIANRAQRRQAAGRCRCYCTGSPAGSGETEFEVWAHMSLGEIFDITGQRERAVNEYNPTIHQGRCPGRLEDGG